MFSSLAIYWHEESLLSLNKPMAFARQKFTPRDCSPQSGLTSSKWVGWEIYTFGKCIIPSFFSNNPLTHKGFQSFPVSVGNGETAHPRCPTKWHPKGLPEKCYSSQLSCVFTDKFVIRAEITMAVSLFGLKPVSAGDRNRLNQAFQCRQGKQPEALARKRRRREGYVDERNAAHPLAWIPGR